MQILKHNSLIALTLLIGTIAHTQGFLHADGERIVNDKGQNVLLRGIGLGGWMLQEGYMLKLNGTNQQHKVRQRIESVLSKEQTQDFYDTWLANDTRKVDVDSLRAWGFNSIRLPMHYDLYTLPIEKEPVPGQQTWIEKGFAMTDSLLSWCKANKMYLILDLHAAPGGQGNDLNISDRDPSLPSLWESDANQQKMVALWRRLAQRYRNEPNIGGYDIINEPNWGFQDTLDRNGQKEKLNAPLRKLMIDISTAIREIDQKHIIIIEGNAWGNNYNGILPVWDKNMVLSFHKYWNKNDQASIQHILDLRSQNKVPVWLGETGENSNTWYTEAIRLFEKNNIGWACWPLKKVGVNNPLEIRSNHNYDHLVEFWNGKRDRAPKESDVYSGLIELATYTRFETNIIHRDVIDAMMRQPHTNATKPFRSIRVAKQAAISAVDYDLGPNGAAYYDLDTANYRSGDNSVGNRGHQYRNDGVDIYKDSTRYEAYYVGHIEAGEWLQFTCSIAAKGNYDVVLSVSSTQAGGAMSIIPGNAGIVRDIAIPDTGGEKKWQSVTIPGVPFNSGSQKLRLLFSSGGFNLRSIELKKK